MKKTLTPSLKAPRRLLLITFYLISSVVSGQGSCPSYSTLYWAGKGSSVPKSKNGTDFNDKKNWSTSSSSYSTPSRAPHSCNNIVINLSLESDVTITFSVGSTEIHNLTFTVDGGTKSYDGILQLNRSALKIGGNTILTATNTKNKTATSLYIQTANSNSVITYGGNITTSSSAKQGSAYVYPFSASSNNLGNFVLNGNATLSGIGDDHTTKPASVVFDGSGTQTITNSNATEIYLGCNTIIGQNNSPTVVLTGTNTDGFKSIQGLTVSNNATLQIEARQSVNRYGSTGNLTMEPGSFMITEGNNFPSGYSSYFLDTESTVDYNAAGAQNVEGVGYGNLILSGSGTKTAQGNLSATGNITIRDAAIFNSGGYNHTLSGNWINNSTNIGFTARTNTITFTGENNQLITGSRRTDFYNLTINKDNTSATVTNSGNDKAFSAANLTVTKGDLVLQAGNDNYNISENVTVARSGVLTHSVPWDAGIIGGINYPGNTSLNISGNLDVAGIFNPTVRSHVRMEGSGNKTIRTGDNPASTLSILTFNNGNFKASGKLVTNQEVWAPFGLGGTFSTNGQQVTFASLLVNNGTTSIDGGKLQVTGTVEVGIGGNPGYIKVTSGDLIIGGDLINGYQNSTASVTITGGTLSIGGKLDNISTASLILNGQIPVKINGSLINDGTLDAGNSTFTFQGTDTRQISGSAGITLYNLEVSGQELQLLKNISLKNNLILTKGIFDMQSYTANRPSSGGTLSAASGSALQLSGNTGGAGNSNFPKNFSTIDLDPASTVNYYGAAQDVYDIPSYGNLVLSNTGLKTASGNLAVRGDFTMQAGATFKAGNFSHTISGNLINNTSDNAFEYDNSKVTFSGTSAQNIGGNYGTSFNAFVMANSVGINLNKPVSIYESLSSNGSGRILNTNDNLTLKSLQDKTAYVGNMTGNTINGKATVERYVAARKAWRFVSVPTTGSETIKDAWQEGALNEASNPAPGYGIQIPGQIGNWAAAGFDNMSYAPSMKYYDGATDTWIGVPNTNTTPISNVKGYMVFVRGDRLVKDVNSTPTETNLRTKDNLKMGTQPVINVLPGKYESIGNPYACPIDFTKISIGRGISDLFYLWDPLLAGVYGYGGYQTFTAANDWKPVPGGTASYPTNVSSSIIPSGQAFFVKGNSGSGSDMQVQISESAKALGNSGTIDRPAGTAIKSEFFRASLFNPSGLLLDGNAVAFNDRYSDSVDGNDALKLAVSGENFGLARQGKSLAVEARSNISVDDTIFYKVSGLARQNYRIAFAPENMDRDLQAVLKDSYTKTATDLSVSDTTWYNFTVNSDAESFSASRFSVVFRPVNTLPVTFGTIKAYAKSNTAIVEWTVYDEKNVKEYQIEQSADGAIFNTIGKQPATNNLNGTYTFTDNQPQAGINYYRIRSVDLDGSSRLSDIAKVNLAGLPSIIEVFPNPVVNDKVQIKFSNQPEGVYQIRLYNSLGQMVKMISKNINTGNQLVTIPLSDKLNAGVYPMVITDNAGIKTTLNVIVK